MTPDPASACTPPIRPIRFFHRGRVVSLDGLHPTRSVLDWLREDASCTGTKEGCNEGDCGACTVVVAELADASRAPDSPAARARQVGDLSLRTVNACLQFVPTLDGKALFTVEDLKRIAAAHPGAPPADAAGEPLHPVQRALVECHGSQCGFCTPGFVMSLWSTYERCQAHGVRPTRQQVADELSGNLCRCTGYRPILDAGERMFDLPAVALDTAPVVSALRRLRDEAGTATTFCYAAPNPAQPADDARAPRRIDRFWAPRRLEALAELRERHPQARLLAGSTDIGLWVTKQFRDLGDVLYLGDVEELRRIERRSAATGETLWIGAGAPLEDAWSSLVQAVPALTDVWLRFASPPVRHAGTMGGNIANGSPIGDSAPVLMALDTTLHLRRGATRRQVPLRDFYLDYMKNRLEPGEFVEGLSVPLPSPATAVRAYKVSKRFDCDISALCAGLAVEFDGDPAAPRVRQARLAFGGLAAIVKHADEAEQALAGRPWSEGSVRAAMAALDRDFTPLTDLRASAGYRRRVARNLLWRFWLETRPQDALAPEATSVFAAMPHEVLGA